jgi:hypothetical protein
MRADLPTNDASKLELAAAGVDRLLLYGLKPNAVRRLCTCTAAASACAKRQAANLARRRALRLRQLKGQHDVRRIDAAIHQPVYRDADDGLRQRTPFDCV